VLFRSLVRYIRLDSTTALTAIPIHDALLLSSISEREDFSPVQSLRKIRFESPNAFNCTVGLLYVIICIAEDISNNKGIGSLVTVPIVFSEEGRNVDILVPTAYLEGCKAPKICQVTDSGIQVHLTACPSTDNKREISIRLCQVGLGLMNRIEQAHTGVINSMSKCARKLLVELCGILEVTKKH